MPERIKAVLRLSLKLAIAAGLTGLLVSYASPSEIALNLRTANLWLILTFIPLTVAAMVLAALQLKVLTDCHGMNVSLPRILSINATTEFYNLFLPGIIAGGAIRWYRLSQHNRMRAQALAAIAMTRLINILVLLILGIVGWLLQDDRANTAYVLWFLLACLGALTCGLLIASDPRFATAARRIVVETRMLGPSIRSALQKLMDAGNEYRLVPPRRCLLLAIYTAGWNVLVLASTYLFCLALSLDVPLSVLTWIRTIVALAMLLPVTISGFGIREGGWIYFLGLYGIAPAEAFALSLLTFVRTLFQAAIGLVLELKTLFAAKRWASHA
jgi:glycosyltransferase 2 family protein